MFKKLFRNIYLPIFLIGVALILFIDVLSVIMLTDTLSDAYESMDKKRISRALDSCELYISSVATSTYNLSLNNTIIEELKNHSDRSLTSLLDNTCNYSLKINGVCAYSADGNIFTSSGIAQVPTIGELRKNKVIDKFIEGNADSVISFRTESIADIYNNVTYPEEMGVITCCRKVYSGDKVVGWLFADILPSNLYDLLLSNGQFNNAVAFITFDNLYFEYSGNAKHANLLSDSHKGYFKYRDVSGDGLFSITVFNSTGEYISRLAVLIIIISATSVLLIAGVHFAAMFTAKSVTKRLDKLSAKMNSQQIA